MKIVVLGAGGVGEYLGAPLAQSGHEVLFVDPCRERIHAIMRHSLRVSGQESLTIS